MAEATPEIQAEEQEAQPLNIFVAGADQAAGLAVAKLAVRAGHNVVGTSATGTDGAMLIRDVGALPIYPDMNRASAIRSAMSMSKADIVINCLAQNILGLPQADTDYETEARNFVMATQALVSAAGQLGVKRFIHISPAFIYGDITEAATEENLTHHGNLVMNAAVDAEAAVRDGAIPTYILRSGFIYGAKSAASKAIADKLRKGGFFPQGDAKVSYIYEDDLAAVAFTLVEADDAPDTLNVADNEPTTHSAFLNQLSTLIGVGEPTGLPAFAVNWRTNELQRAMLVLNAPVDASKVKEILNWSPEYPTQESGIERMLLIWRAVDAAATASDEKVVNTSIVKA